MAEGVLILEPGDERAKKIGKAMANESANAILSALKGRDLTLSEISEELGQPMTTVKYHVENLLDAELIVVRRIKYSEKGREVKVYGVNERLVIVAPLGGDIKGTLLKYASVFALLVLATLALIAVSPAIGSFQPTSGSPYDDGILPASTTDQANVFSSMFSGDNRTSATVNTENETFMTKSGSGDMSEAAPIDTAGSLTAQTAPSDAGQNGVMHLFVIMFFLGGCLILFVMVIYEVVVWRREKKFWENIAGEEKQG